MGTLRILIADDHELFRESMAVLLRTKPEIASADVVAVLEELPSRVDELSPDVLLLDLQMERPALALMPTLAARTRVIVLSANDQLDQMMAAVRAGARGVVSKAAAVETLMQAIRVVARGDVWLSPALQTKLVNTLGAPPDRLTPREREIARLVALGMRNAEVGAALYISAITVKTHLARIFDKLEIRDRADLVLYAVRSGLIGVDEKKP